MNEFVIAAKYPTDTVTTSKEYQVKLPIPTEIVDAAIARPTVAIVKPTSPVAGVSVNPQKPVSKLFRLLETIRAYAANEEPDFE